MYGIYIPNVWVNFRSVVSKTWISQNQIKSKKEPIKELFFKPSDWLSDPTVFEDTEFHFLQKC